MLKRIAVSVQSSELSNTLIIITKQLNFAGREDSTVGQMITI